MNGDKEVFRLTITRDGHADKVDMVVTMTSIPEGIKITIKQNGHGGYRMLEVCDAIQEAIYKNAERIWHPAHLAGKFLSALGLR